MLNICNTAKYQINKEGLNMNTLVYKISFKQADQVDSMINEFGYTKTIAAIQASDLFTDDECTSLCDYVNNHKLIAYRNRCA